MIYAYLCYGRYVREVMVNLGLKWHWLRRCLSSQWTCYPNKSGTIPKCLCNSSIRTHGKGIPQTNWLVRSPIRYMWHSGIKLETMQHEKKIDDWSKKILDISISSLQAPHTYAHASLHIYVLTHKQIYIHMNTKHMNIIKRKKC